MSAKMAFNSDYLKGSYSPDSGDWGFEHLGVLHKAVCVDIAKNENPDTGKEYGLVFRCKDGTTRTAWIMMDAEGNGAGHLDIVSKNGKTK